MVKIYGTVNFHPALLTEIDNGRAVVRTYFFFLHEKGHRVGGNNALCDNLGAAARTTLTTERTGCGVHLGKTGSHHHPEEHNA